MSPALQLRAVENDDLPIFFAQMQNREAIHMAAFTHEDPSDFEAHVAHWKRILANDEVLTQTIVVQDRVVGHVASFVMFGQRDVTYWIGPEHWGKGYATGALRAFLELDPIRPLHARAAKDNLGSLRVLEKCGFEITGEDQGFAHGRGCETEEYILTLSA